MRLDHLLSKENRVFVLSPGWVLVSIPLVAEFLFSGGELPVRIVVRIGGSVKQG